MIIIIELSNKKYDKILDYCIAYSVGFAFGYGLIQSGMVNRHLVLNFLAISSSWNITLLFVLATAVISFSLI